MPPDVSYKKSLGAALFITLVITFLVYRPCLNNELLQWDDKVYLADNFTIHNLNFSTLKTIFTSNVIGNHIHDYQPLTMLSFALEYHFFHLNPKIYHATNLTLHLFNTALVLVFIFLLYQRIEGAWIVALLFAVHPMQVETVAWVSARKDLLSTFFYLGCLIFYCLWWMTRSRQAPL